MSVDDILAELDSLSPDELMLIQGKLDLLKEDFEETPEMLAAIDEGLRSSEEDGPGIPIEVLENRLVAWTTAEGSAASRTGALPSATW